MGAFLLNEHFGCCNVAVNEVGALFFCDGLYWELELHHFGRVVDAEDRMEKVYPKALGLTFLVTLSGPFFYKLFCGLFLCIGCVHPVKIAHSFNFCKKSDSNSSNPQELKKH